MAEIMHSRCSVLGVVAFATACATSHSNFPPDSAARPTVGVVPARFVFDASAVNTDSAAVPACASPLVDIRTGTRLVLVRSEQGRRGDYAVTPPSYGVGPTDLLRVDCRGGAVIGIVAR